MSKLNLKEASLLDISGELGEGAREELKAKIAVDSAAFSEYEKIQANFKLLEYLPIPEPSAAERKHIPAMIKMAIHAALPLQKEAVASAMGVAEAIHHKQLRNWMAGWKGRGLVLACLGIAALLIWGNEARSQPADALVAHINAVIDHSLATVDPMVLNQQDGAGLPSGSESAGSLTLAEERDLDLGQLLKHQEPPAGGTGSDDVVGSSSPPGSF